MDRISIRWNSLTFILYQDEVREIFGSDFYVIKTYDVRELQKDSQEIEWLRENGYYYEYKNLKYSPCRELLINEEKRRFEQEQRDGFWTNYRYRIRFRKYISIEDIQSFYDFCLEIEIGGIRMQVYLSQAYVDAAYVDSGVDEKLDQVLTALVGEPQIVPESEHEKGARPNYYIVPVSKIDKIIGIKKYRELSNWNKYPREYIREEEIVLDLHHFDLETYKIFERHEMLFMYKDEEWGDEYKYERIQ